MSTSRRPGFHPLTTTENVAHTSSTTNDTSTDYMKPASIGLVIGILIGIFVGAVIVVCYRRRKQNNYSKSSSKYVHDNLEFPTSLEQSDAHVYNIHQPKNSKHDAIHSENEVPAEDSTDHYTAIFE